MYIYWIVISALMLTALVITIRIGMSRENKRNDNQYYKGAGAKLLKLTSYYVIVAVIGVIVFLAYLYYR